MAAQEVPRKKETSEQRKKRLLDMMDDWVAEIDEVLAEPSGNLSSVPPKP
jgi:hypothetical protein